ncbi:MAG: hypothetical protein KVP17_001098 [Porospora cf. gigantea B]|uniref:uncharacterized protein n=1 Tax=Porospora cf. gigantea B TaxID=2853592 RepID=UPI003571B8DC|nr:MAG: hypothetical protein KVP17_001098 [Porospora cf. gigantea B]
MPVATLMDNDLTSQDPYSPRTVLPLPITQLHQYQHPYPTPRKQGMWYMCPFLGPKRKFTFEGNTKAAAVC